MAHKTLIIVDPDKTLRVRLRRGLESTDWEQAYCDDCATAVTHLLARGGHAMLLSLKATDMAEFASVYRARELRSPDELALLVTSGESDIPHLQKYLGGLNINGWLQAPCSVDDVLEYLPTGQSTPKHTVDALNVMLAQLVQCDFFERLGVARDSNLNVIRRAYNHRMREFDIEHIEGNPNDVRRVHRAITQALNEALATLRNSERRAKYLKQLTGTGGDTPDVEHTSTAARAASNDAREETVPAPPHATPNQSNIGPDLPPPSHQQSSGHLPQPAPPPSESASDTGSMDLLNELRASAAQGQSSPTGNFDSILEGIVDRHRTTVPDTSAPAEASARLGALFSAAVGAVSSEEPVHGAVRPTTPKTAAPTEHLSSPPQPELAPPVSAPQSPTNGAPNTPAATTQANTDTAIPGSQYLDEDPLPDVLEQAHVSDTAPTPVAESTAENAEDPLADTDWSLESQSPAGSAQDSATASEEDLGPAAPEPLKASDDSQVEDAGSGEAHDGVLDFDDLGGIFDLDEDDAAAIVDAALAGHAASTPEVPEAPAEVQKETVEDEASAGPMSAAQMAAIALEESTKNADKSTKAAKDAEPDEPDVERTDAATALAPDSRVYDYSARMNALMGKFDKATQLIVKAQANNPSRRLDYRLELIRAQEFVANEQPEEAKALLQRLVSAHNNSDEADELLATLVNKRTGIMSLFAREEK